MKQFALNQFLGNKDFGNGVVVIYKNRKITLVNRETMAFNEKIAERIRERLAEIPNVEEKAMMGGLTFMVNDKMCIGIIKDEMMCRIDPDLHETVVERTGCRTMDFTKRPMKGYVMVEDEGMRSERDFDYLINLCLEYNERAKSSKKKKRP